MSSVAARKIPKIVILTAGLPGAALMRTPRWRPESAFADALCLLVRSLAAPFLEAGPQPGGLRGKPAAPRPVPDGDREGGGELQQSEIQPHVHLAEHRHAHEARREGR